MKTPVPLTNRTHTATIDLKRTERAIDDRGIFYWAGDKIVHAGRNGVDMTGALLKLKPKLRQPFKMSLISFSKQGNHSSLRKL